MVVRRIRAHCIVKRRQLVVDASRGGGECDGLAAAAGRCGVHQRCGAMLPQVGTNGTTCEMPFSIVDKAETTGPRTTGG